MLIERASFSQSSLSAQVAGEPDPNVGPLEQVRSEHLVRSGTYVIRIRRSLLQLERDRESGSITAARDLRFVLSKGIRLHWEVTTLQSGISQLRGEVNLRSLNPTF